MSGTPLPVVAYEREHHEAALYRFVEKVLGAEKCERRRRVIDTMHTTMPGHDRFPLRYVIVDGDRVAGSMGHMPADFWIKGKRVAARFTHDLLVDPDYRGGGLARLLVDNARAQGDFFPGGMWMTQPCHQIHVKCGFAEATPLTTYSMVLNPALFAARKQLSPLKALVARAGLGVSGALALRRARRDAARAGLEEIKRFDSGLDPVWEKLGAGYGVTRVRDAAYLNWKYMDHPSLVYRALVARRGAEVVGYMIWRLAP
ncbi:MAG TPA: GNAT family N-acetyltransferase, partial [Candidatus Krumholzibacteria bacterium]|nr:GNAT family N-acetyltransferase [Candidatus Krumholzibacteria bacterium]